MIDNNLNIDWLLQNSTDNPERIAIINTSIKLTFRELNQKVDNTSRLLNDAGIKDNQHCALISGNNLDFLILILALWRIGAVPIPLNIRLTNEELQHQIAFTNCKFVLTDKKSKSNFVAGNNYELLQFPFDYANLPISSFINRNFSSDKTSLILFTSGSTERPKAVVFSFKNFYSSAVQTCKLGEAEENDKWLASLPFYHIGGFMIFVRALVNGNTLLIPSSMSINDLIYCIHNFNPAFISFVSTQLTAIMKDKIMPNKKIKALFLGGGPIDKYLITEAKAFGWPVIKVYGSTESCSMVSALDLRISNNKIDSAGKEIFPNSISINGSSKGEIIIKSDSVAKSYYNDESNKLSNSIFHSNDFGYIDNEGYLFIEGRIDDIIISGGENINSNEVTKMLLENHNIIDAFTFGMKDDKWGESVACAIVMKNTIDELSIKEFLKTKIASYKIPKKIFFIDSIPKTELDKVKKDELFALLKLY